MSSVQIRPLRGSEIESFARLGHYAFDGRGVEQRIGDFTRRVRAERQCLVADDDGQIVSQVMIYEFQTWIGGVSFPTGGLANVATVPEQARRGLASKLLRETLRWMRDELGQCLSTLFPTVHPLYAGLGWSLAESGVRYVGSPAAFRPSEGVPIDPGGRVERRPAQIEDVDLLNPLYRRYAAPRSGYLDRPRWYWEDYLLRPVRGNSSPWLALWRNSVGEIAGYAQYTMNDTPSTHLRIYEIVASCPEAYRGLLEFFAAHHLLEKIHFFGGGDVPWRHLVANPHHLDLDVASREHVLVRLVDLAKAIELRRVDLVRPVTDVLLRVHDDAASWNDGIWRIGVQDQNDAARWTCVPSAGGTATAELDISSLSSLFVGFLSVRQAIDVGALRVESGAIPTLEALFKATYPPHFLDHF